MADISKLTIGSNTYNFKDAQARSDIATISQNVSGAMHYAGVTTTVITDGSSTSPIVIGGASVAATSGMVIMYGDKEFIYSDTDGKWHEFGDWGDLGALAMKDSASGTYTPQGSISQPTFTGTQANITSTVTGAGTISVSTSTGTSNYTPQGSVSTPTITVTPSTSTFNSITSVGAQSSFSASVANETLSFSWTPNTLPTYSAKTVATGISSSTATKPTFTGTGVKISGTFTGTQTTGTATYTPQGSISTPSFTGTAGTVTVT